MKPYLANAKSTAERTKQEARGIGGCEEKRKQGIVKNQPWDIKILTPKRFGQKIICTKGDLHKIYLSIFYTFFSFFRLFRDIA